jgi:basic membrane protein A and related proteins
VDTDGCVAAQEYCSLILTTVEKHMNVAVEDTVKATLDGTFKGGLYVGTLANNGVGIAPYHDLESIVPQELQAKIDELKQGIIDGTVSVDPKDYPAS